MLGTSGGNSYTPTTLAWPYCGEIDIMEHWGNNPNYIHGSIHNGSSSGSTVNTSVVFANDVSTEYHIYSLNWSPNQISFLVDNDVFYTYKPSVKNANTWPFDAPQYILLNVAMGGIGGTIDPNFVSSAMEVDYVRVYKEKALNVENNDIAKIKVSPNPVSNFLYILAPQNAIGAKAKLYSIVGKELDSFVISDVDMVFDYSKFSSGVYILKIESKDAFSQFRLIKK